MSAAANPELRRTALHGLHLHLGARMVPFAGWEMPLHFSEGILREHLHTRSAAGLFDVSHMGQVILRPRSGRIADAARALERLVPADILGLPEGRQRYALFTDESGGILDDLMVANRGDHLLLVVNAARTGHDLAHLEAHLSDLCAVEPLDRALIALQGPAAEAALSGLVAGVAALRFMEVGTFRAAGAELWISRSGYTGEDGFEISVPAEAALGLAGALLARPEVRPAGLGARDSLRLEAGLPLWGSDIDATTSPVEAGLSWAIPRVRRAEGARAGGFPGAARILHELVNGAPRRRMGLLPEGRAPMRAGTAIFAAEAGGEAVGHVTSGGFGPSLDRPVAMGYLAGSFARLGTRLWGEVRGRRLPVAAAALPFHPHSYRR
jgi:aminomethyltransferase